MIKKALDFINKEIEGCIMNIEFCKHKGYDSPFHDQRLIDLNNLKEAFEKLVDKETPKKVIKEIKYDAYDDNDRSIDFEYNITFCPHCKFDLVNEIEDRDFEDWDYCLNCGQKLDWRN